MLGVVRGPQQNIQVGDETLSIGGHRFPLYCADGDVVAFKSSEIL